jgi:ABC-type bacteriocin/lantibiotic exporter with double-glycine peptidase domain
VNGYAKPKAVCDLDISKGGVNLYIPDVAWDPKKADLEAGWCGEASIQMAFSYYGKKVDQDVIHREGKPKNSDLQDDDLEVALQALGAVFTRYEGEAKDSKEFVAWIQEQLRSKYPVICGCKIYPTDQPNWDVDHFVLVSGYNAKGLLMNTQLDCDGQVLVKYKELSSTKEGYSFINPRKIYWGAAVTGVR